MATVTRKRQLGRQVSIVGAGLSQFGAFPDKDSRDLFVEAFHDMMETMDKPFDIDDIECAYIGNYSSDLFETQGHTAPIVADWLGMTPIPITRIENACASSGSALREGVMAIASGMYDIVLVGGMEKMTNLPTEGVTDVLASAADGLYEVPAGLTFPGIFGAIAKAHMDRYETNLDHLLKVGIKNHQNGALNPKAQFNVTIQDMMERRKARAEQRGQTVPDWQTELDFLHDEQANPWIAWPLRLYDCAPYHRRRFLHPAGIPRHRPQLHRPASIAGRVRAGIGQAAARRRRAYLSVSGQGSCPPGLRDGRHNLR